jgi:hypothetical protein
MALEEATDDAQGAVLDRAGEARDHRHRLLGGEGPSDHARIDADGRFLAGDLGVDVDELTEGLVQRDHELLPLQELADLLDQLVVVPGLAEEAAHLAGVDRGQHRVEVGVPRKDQAERQGRPDLDLGEELGAVHPGHPEVREDDVGAKLAEPGERLLAAQGALHLEARPAQETPQRLGDLLLVVHNQDPVHPSSDRRSFPGLERPRKLLTWLDLPAISYRPLLTGQICLGISNSYNWLA